MALEPVAAGGGPDLVELQLRRLAHLESLCANRTAGEARAAALVAQLEAKIRQFEQQTAANMGQAEQELARLSGELQLSLQRQRDLRSRAEEGESRRAQLKQAAEEGAELRRRAAQDRGARDACVRQLQALEQEAERLRSQLRASDDELARRRGRLSELRRGAERRRRQELTEAALRATNGLRLLGRAFAAMLQGCAWQRRARRCLAALGSRHRRLLASWALAAWRGTAAGARSLRRRSADRHQHLLAFTVHRWALCARWLASGRRSLARRSLAALLAASRASAAERVGRAWRRTLAKVVREWRAVAGMALRCRGVAHALQRSHARRSLRSVARGWAAAARAAARRRRAAEELSRRLREAALRRALARAWRKGRRLRLSCGGRRGPRRRQASAHGGCSQRLALAVLGALRQHAASQRCVARAFADLPARAGARLVPKAFAALRRLWERRRRLSALRALERGRAAAGALRAWAAAARRRGRARAASAAVAELRKGWAAQRWHKAARVARAARQLQELRSPAGGSRRRAPAGSFASRRGAAVGWWACWALRGRWAAGRGRLVASRRRLGLLRLALRLWDEAVVASFREACDSLRQREAHLAAEEAARRRGERARREMEAEVEHKAAEAAELASKAREAKGAIARLLELLEGERSTSLALEDQARRLQEEARGRAEAGSVSVLGALEAQLEEAAEVQGSLRFSLLRAEAEGERARASRELAESRTQELQGHLGEAQASYVRTVEAMDWRIAELAQEDRRLVDLAGQLERALEGATARAETCAAELQNFRAATAAAGA